MLSGNGARVKFVEEFDERAGEFGKFLNWFAPKAHWKI